MRQTFFNVTSLRGPCVRKRGTFIPTGVAYLYEGVTATSIVILPLFVFVEKDRW